MSDNKGRSFFRREDAKTASKTEKKSIPAKRERPFEKFRLDKNTPTTSSATEKPPRKAKSAFDKEAFHGKAASYNDRVAIPEKQRSAAASKSKGLGKSSGPIKIENHNEPVRLNRFIAQSGVCSRREADQLIADSLVTVNGIVVTELGTKVSRDDRIELEGKKLQGEKRIYIVMNKPKGYITSMDDPHNERTVIDLLKGEIPQRVYPVGRLDKNTTGVLLLTNDGDLTKELTHPSYEKRKIYHVFLDKPCTEDDLEKLLSGIELEDGRIAADDVSFVESTRKEVGIELHSGRNRIVRRMFEHLGYEVIKLDRVYFGGLTKLGLRRGFWRVLSEKEVSTLKSGNYR